MATTDDMLTNSVNTVKQYGLIKDGDIVVISGGVPLGYRGTTNIMKVHVVGDVIMRGIAIGTGSYKGSVCIVQSLHDAMEKIAEGDIMVVNETDNSFIPYIKKAGAIICQSSDKSGHVTIAGSALDKIVLLCEHDPVSILHDGMRVTVDADRGLVINAG
jgi:pyruvate kinase